MTKRGKLEIIRDILSLIKENHSIKYTPLLRKSNIASNRFKEYYSLILEKKFVMEHLNNKNEKYIILTEKGFKFLERYNTLINFIEEFEL